MRTRCFAILTAVIQARFTPFILLLTGLFFLPSIYAGGTLARHQAEIRGEFGADLRVLASFTSGPQNPHESNFFIDMWEGQQFARLVRSGGMTNNRTLFVNSHGTARPAGLRTRYAYYPHDSLVNKANTPYFSARDIATVLGPHAREIHNIVIGGCNEERAFRAAELRHYFPNATNITHSANGQLGYQPMLLQAIFSPSHTISPLYETPVVNDAGETEYEIGTEKRPRSTLLPPYVAQLYLPGANKPFREQTAGRELLDPSYGPLSLSDVASLMTE